MDTPAYDRLRSRFYEKLWHDTAAEMGATIEDFGSGYLRISCGANHTFVNGAKVQLDDHLSLRIAGNKPLVYRILSEYDYPIQKFLEYNIGSLSKAYRFMQAAGKPCVVKPAAGSGAGNGITTKISTFKQLRRASMWAATFSPRLLIEEEITGESYRLLYLGGEFIDAIRRKPPQVTGDGKQQIRRLMQQENRARLNGDAIVALCPLVVDFESELHLASAGLKLSDVLPANQTISVKTVSNQNRNAENESVRDQVHPSIVQAGAKMAQIFKLKLAGVDVLTMDISKPLEAVSGVFGEVNTSPGLHHHYLISNPQKGAQPARQVLEYIFNHT